MALTPQQLKEHKETYALLVQVHKKAFSYVAQHLHEEKILTEQDIEKYIFALLEKYDLVMDKPHNKPVVATTKNAAQPHHESGTETVCKGDLLLLDIWARRKSITHGIYADITWMGYCGKNVPENYAKKFSLIIKARDLAVELIAQQPLKTHTWQADKVSRDFLTQQGVGKEFIHTLGHDIDTKVHGENYRLDSGFRNKDEHLFEEGDLFSIEPGIYKENEYGFRTEINAYIFEGKLVISGEIQKEIQPLLLEK